MYQIPTYEEALVQGAVVSTMRMLGVTSGEVSYRKGSELYGKWFRDAVKAGRLTPIRVGERKESYSLIDILTLIASDRKPATLKVKI